MQAELWRIFFPVIYQSVILNHKTETNTKGHRHWKEREIERKSETEREKARGGAIIKKNAVRNE